jgi:hypothetical protein
MLPICVFKLNPAVDSVNWLIFVFQIFHKFIQNLLRNQWMHRESGLYYTGVHLKIALP